MWHFLRLILFAGLRCINSTTGYWMDGHYVNHVCMYTKTYLCICVSAILYICMSASCIFVQTLIPFCSRTSHVTTQAKTPPAQPPRHDVIHAIYIYMYAIFQWALLVYMLQYTTRPSNICCNTPHHRPKVLRLQRGDRLSAKNPKSPQVPNVRPPQMGRRGCLRDVAACQSRLVLVTKFWHTDRGGVCKIVQKV